MRNWTLLSYSVWFVANITIIIVVVVVRCVQHNKYHNNNWLLYSAKLSVVIHTATQRSFVNSTLSAPVNLSYSSYTYNKFCDENPDDFCSGAYKYLPISPSFLKEINCACLQVDLIVNPNQTLHHLMSSFRTHIFRIVNKAATEGRKRLRRSCRKIPE